MKILITGVNGFIGQHLAEKLIKNNYLVVGIGRRRESKIKKLTYLQGSVLNRNLIKKAIKDIDIVVHLAALTSHKEITENTKKTQKINLEGTKNILDAFSKSSAKKFIFPSTGKVYGETKHLPIDENHPTKPKNILGKSKLETEKLIESYKKFGKQIFIFRIFNVYGPGNRNYLIPTILNQINRKENEITLGDIKAKRDYLYIDDLVDAFMLAIKKNSHKEINIYNICSGVSYSAREIVNLISKIKKMKISIKVNPNLLRKDESPNEYGSYKLAKENLGWYPKIGLEKGLKILCKQ